MPLQVTHSQAFIDGFTDAQRAIPDAYFAGHTSDKAMSRALGTGVAGLRSRLNALMYKADIPFGTKRDQAMLMLWEKGYIEVKKIAAQAIASAGKNIAVALLCLLSSGFTVPQGLHDNTTDGARLGRARRNPGRTGTRRGRDPFQQLIDQTTEGFEI